MSPPRLQAESSGIRGDSDASAMALAVKPWLMKRPLPAGNPVGMLDDLCVFKSDKAEGFGTDAVHIAFGKRPRNRLLCSGGALQQQQQRSENMKCDCNGYRILRCSIHVSVQLRLRHNIKSHRRWAHALATHGVVTRYDSSASFQVFKARVS